MGWPMKVLLHDLSQEEIIKYGADKISEDMVVLTKMEREPNKCIGCFGCWVKNPGQCVLHDEYNRMGEYLGNCTEVIIVSKCIYGEFSPYVKKLIDRSISICHPYFTTRAGKMHHKLRYDNQPKLTVYFYGYDLTNEEKNTAEGRVKGMRINFGASENKITFLDNKEQLGGIKQW